MNKMELCPSLIVIGICLGLLELTLSVSAVCYKDGKSFHVGTFDDPSDRCGKCECKKDGRYRCKVKTCPAPKCGESLLRLAKDGCCSVCSRICQGEICSKINCPKERHYYKPGSCCPECGCKYQKKVVPQGLIPVRCETCRCKANGEVRCKRPECSAVKLECVDPDFDKDCNYFCPNGKTCQQGDQVIKYGEFKIVGNAVCACVGDWYPRAFCNKRMDIAIMEKMEKTRCVADATRYKAWKNIEMLYSTPVLAPPPQLVFPSLNNV